MDYKAGWSGVYWKGATDARGIIHAQFILTAYLHLTISARLNRIDGQGAFGYSESKC
jgi:hypothetical protein